MPKIANIEEMWFEYPEDSMEGSVLIRHLKEGEVQQIISRETETKTTFNIDTAKPETVVFQKNPVIALTIASIKAWKNFFDGKASKGNPNGKPLPCSEENIRLFCLEDGFLNFISESREKLTEIIDKRKKDQEKN